LVCELGDAKGVFYQEAGGSRTQTLKTNKTTNLLTFVKKREFEIDGANLIKVKVKQLQEMRKKWDGN
jgi:hypothetical protein